MLATVVWSSGLSSGKQGCRAIISADGRMRGWLGGACAAPTLTRVAREVLTEGRARLVVLGPDHGLAGGQRQGVEVVPMACDSEGTMEVYLEPVFPSPHLVAVGNSPAVGALTTMARALGWRTSVVDDGGRSDDHHPDDRVFLSLDLSAVGVDRQTMVVVATQGHYDEEGFGFGAVHSGSLRRAGGFSQAGRGGGGVSGAPRGWVRRIWLGFGRRRVWTWGMWDIGRWR